MALYDHLTREQEIPLYIARHEDEIAFQQKRAAKTFGVTQWLARQRIQSCQEAIARLHLEQARTPA